MDLTFLVPTRIETEDRLRNIISSVSYLLYHTNAKEMMLKKYQSILPFKFRAIPEIKKYVGTKVLNLTHIFEESDEDLFCKSKVLNDLIVASDTKVVTKTTMLIAFFKGII